MTYGNMKKRIVMLEENVNKADYPEEVMKKRPWTFKYLNELLERSVNGARSPKAIAHLKKVCNTLYATVAAIGVIIVVIIAILSVLAIRK
jgi:hypothetical protein